jgi:hypothetical protein
MDGIYSEEINCNIKFNRRKWDEKLTTCSLTTPSIEQRMKESVFFFPLNTTLETKATTMISIARYFYFYTVTAVTIILIFFI